MSASVASSAVGLLDRHYSPPSLRDDTMEVDGLDDVKHEDMCGEEAPMKTTQFTARSDTQAELDRHDAIGGLLAALATSATSKTAHIAQRRSATPPAGTPLSQTSDAQLPDDTATGPEQQEQSTSDEVAPAVSTNLPSANAEANSLDDQTAFPLMPSDPILTMPTEEQFEAAIAQDDMNIPFPPFDVPLDQYPTSPLQQLPINVKRQIDAYARLEFADGTFYLNTFQCELGRDQHAFRDALKREQEAKEVAEAEKEQPKSSSGRASQRSQIIKAESQVQGSVVSEAGGFAGVDEKPVDSFEKRNEQEGNHNSSHASESDVVRPAEVLHNPSLAPYDYHKDVVYQPAQFAAVPEDEIVENERPAPVTTEHLPNPNSCPLIPIHTTVASEHTEVQNLRAISRRHVRIFWNWDESAFFLEVLGRNGAFFEDQHMKRGEAVRLHSGAKIQISAVEFVFRLPDTLGEPITNDDDSNAASDELLDTPSTPLENGQPVKLKLRLNTDTNGAQNSGPNNELKRRGPGRPPKNGIMSQREMKEREKAEKEAKARGISGAPSPPALERKLSKTQIPKPDLSPEIQRAEKRKYTKRKREDGEEEDILPSIEAQDETPPVQALPPPLQVPPQQQQQLPPAKRARTKSYSPEYKPFDKCTQEDLARPPHNYAVLLYMVLSETGEITLRQIYKQMQARWPFFKYCVESDGWTSSVRHNLNQEVGKLFERGRKEGKGFTWLPKPNAMEEYQAQKNKRSNAPPQPKPRPPTQQRPSLPPNHGQQLTWQNNGPNGQQKGPPQGWQANKAGQTGQPSSGPAQHNGMTPAQARDPNYVPPVHMLHHHFGRPAPVFMPVTFEGLAVIHRFEQSMFQNLKQDTETQAKWRAIFHSAKQQALHGAKASLLPGGESDEEATILKHIRNFVERYKNPAFAGFGIRTASPATSTPAPAPTPAAAAPVPQAEATPQPPKHAAIVNNATPTRQLPASAGTAPTPTPARSSTLDGLAKSSADTVVPSQSVVAQGGPAPAQVIVKSNTVVQKLPPEHGTTITQTPNNSTPKTNVLAVAETVQSDPEVSSKTSAAPNSTTSLSADGASISDVGSTTVATPTSTNMPPAARSLPSSITRPATNAVRFPARSHSPQPVSTVGSPDTTVVPPSATSVSTGSAATPVTAAPVNNASTSALAKPPLPSSQTPGPIAKPDTISALQNAVVKSSAAQIDERPAPATTGVSTRGEAAMKAGPDTPALLKADGNAQQTRESQKKPD